MASSFMDLSRRRLLQVASLGSLAQLVPWQPALAAGTATLRLMETTDLHCHLYPYDYYRDREDVTVGLARIATLVAKARGEVPNSLLLDNGDFLQGNPLGDWMAYERGMKDGDLHPVIGALNALRIDAATLGNHEFNYGLSFLEKSLAGAAFPLVLANIVKGQGGDPTKDRAFLPPFTILERQITDGAGQQHPIRVGVMGLTPPQIMIWDKANLEGNIQARDIYQAAAAWMPALREQKPDIIVILSHSGIAAGGPDGAENASSHLGRIDGVDVVMTGHLHRVFPGETFKDIDGVDAAKGTIFGKPAIMPGFWGSHLGIVDLTLARDGNSWRILESRVENRPISQRVDGKTTATVESDPRIIEVAKPAHDSTLAYVRRPVGEVTGPITSYFALVADDPSVQIVSIAQIWYTKQMLAGGPYANLPVLSAAAPFKAGGRGGADYYTDVAKGPIAIKNVADLYLYPNTARAVLVDGATVREWLERSAGIFNQISANGPEQKLIDDSFPSYNFDVIDGVSYEIDVTQPSRYDGKGKLIAPDAHRIINLTYAGKPIDPAQKFVVATNNYRAAGGGTFPGVDGSNIILEAPDTNRDVLVRYIVEQKSFDPSADNNWKIAPTTGTTKLIFETGPGAKAHLADARVKFEEAGTTPEGFLKLAFLAG